MVAVQAYLSGKQAYILIVNPFPPLWTLIEVHPLFESFTHPSPRLWKHTHPPPPLDDWLWALIDNRSSKSPPLSIMKLQCFYRNDGRYLSICQSVLEPALLLFLVLLYFHCTTPSSNLVTAVHDDSNLVEIFIFTRKETSAELDKILPICFCSNPVQSLAELNKCLVEQRSIRCTIPLQDVPSPLQVAWIDQLWQKPIKLKRNFRRK